MLTEIYIEALLVDEELADQVWEAWDAGEIDNRTTLIAWWLIVFAGTMSGGPTVRRSAPNPGVCTV